MMLFYRQIVWLVGCVLACLSCADGRGEGGPKTYEYIDETCGVTFHINAQKSPIISTVGIIEWHTTLKEIDAAHIAFGTEGRLNLKAPVNLNAPDFRTLLLGMKPRSTYWFRVVATSGERVCMSDIYSIETGGESTALGPVHATANDAGSHYGGYTVSSTIKRPFAFVLDNDGEYVWWYKAPINTISRARMSADGKYMLIGNLNLKNNGTGAIVKVSMDGLDEEIISLADRHHDFTVLPEDGTIAYIEYEENGVGTCDRVVERIRDGATRVVYTIRDDFSHREEPLEEWCHSNAINYVPREDAYYLSVLRLNAILKIDRQSGSLVWVLGGEDSTFVGTSWTNQHQHQLLDNGNILLFSNGMGGFEAIDGSRVLEYRLEGSTASEIWRYDSDAASSSLGDVQRLGNGNTVITYSNAGLIQEVETDTGRVLVSFQWLDDIVAYTIRRESLYGPPQGY